MRPVIGAVVIAVSLSVSARVPIAEHARPERLPIVDFHTHLNGDMEAKHLLALMDRAGVRTMVLMARYYANPKDAGYGSDMQAADFARTHKGRFVPFVAGQRGELGRLAQWEAPKSASWYLRESEDKLRTGGFFGLGADI